MDKNFYHTETLSVRQYNYIIHNATRRLRIWHKELNVLQVRHSFMQREINLIRYSKKMINLIQSQLN